ncbi:MAG: hypothetical protein SPL50_06995 [Alloprevotella sp.]|nr:hypothetical protein [Alloprevotella sp.]
MKQKENLYSLVGCGVMLVAALLFDWMEAFGQSIGLMKMGIYTISITKGKL